MHLPWKGEAEAWGAGRSTPQPCHTQSRARLRDHGCSLGPPHPRGLRELRFSGCGGALSRLDSAPGSGGEGAAARGAGRGGWWGRVPRTGITALRERGWGSYSTRALLSSQGALSGHNHRHTHAWAHPWVNPTLAGAPAPPRHPRQEPALLHTHPQALIHQVSALLHASLGLGLGALGHTGKVLLQEEAEDQGGFGVA